MFGKPKCETESAGLLSTARAVTFALAVALTPGLVVGQDLSLKGPSDQSVTVGPSDIAAMPHVTLTVSVEGKTHTYAGVPLTDLLGRVGAPAGKALKGAALSDVVIVTAKDGYVVALALAETDPLVRKDQVLLADRIDGAPMPDGLGPYRLVVEGDQRGARLARMVTSIEVRQLAPQPAK
jgi:DMSO/TMAO reductase YedYZ molybdopterin-dependent catalytic subunit